MHTKLWLENLKGRACLKDFYHTREDNDKNGSLGNRLWRGEVVVLMQDGQAFVNSQAAVGFVKSGTFIANTRKNLHIEVHKLVRLVRW